MPELKRMLSVQGIHHTHIRTVGAREATGWDVLMPSLPTHTNQEKLFQNNQNHDLIAPFGLASASLVQMRPIFLLIGYEIFCGPICKAMSSNLENHIFSWVGSGRVWIRAQQACLTSTCWEIFSKIRVINHLKLNTQGNFNTPLYKHVHTQCKLRAK